MQEQKITRTASLIAQTALAVSIILFLLPTISSQIDDPDFWYHLSSGRYVIEHRTLIQDDPFSYTTTMSGAPDASMHSDNLRGYWLSQVMMYLTYHTLGFYGIVSVRVAMYITIFLLLCLWAIGRGAHPLAVAFLLIPSGLFIGNYTGDRPQIVSFILAPAVLYCLEGYVKKPKDSWPFIVLPALMIVWANAHRGYPMGAALIVLYSTVEISRSFIKKDTPPGYRKGLALLAGLGVCATLINPNIYGTYLAMLRFEGSPLQRVILEYKPTLETGVYGITLWPYLVYLALSIIAILLSARRMRASEIILFTLLGVASLKAFRYVPFFLLCTLPVSATALTSVLQKWPKLSTSRALLTIAPVILILLMAAYSLTLDRGNIARLADSPVVQTRYPEAAVQAILAGHPSGHLLNDWSWGGYLMWHLPYKDYPVFVDTRTLNMTAFRQYVHMNEADPAGISYLDSYDIRIVLIPGMNDFTGARLPLFDHLVHDPQWRLIHYDDTCVLFVRGQENSALIARSAMPSAYALEHIILRSALMAPVSQPTARAAFIEQSRRAKAEFMSLTGRAIQ